jgi:HlyD family secretion protein
MDVKRDPAILKKKKMRRAALGVVAVIVLGAVTVVVSRLEPAAPTVAANSVWFGTVKRGSMVREVRGPGTLVPEDIRWIPATTSGRVERIILRPGAEVKPGTLILELSNPDLKQQVVDADLAVKSAVAQLENARAGLKTTRLSQELAVADAKSSYEVALSDLDANKQLAEQGLVAGLVIQQKEAAVKREKNRWDLAQKQLDSAVETEKSQLAPQEAAVSQAKARYDQLARQAGDLMVKSTMSGQLQLLGVEEGQQVGPGTNLARVSDPTRLKAQVRIPETQTRDLALGQLAKIDTRNGIVKGRVTRIDPASQNGTVGVDVILDDALPAGSRPDQSVDGVVELQRLDNVLYVESPTFGQEDATTSLFKVLDDGTAVRTSVKLGKRSVQFVEVLEGLKEGDKIILSDMSAYDNHDKVRLN